MSKKHNSDNHIETIDEKSCILYPNFHNFDAGQEPAILIKVYYEVISISQGDQNIILPFGTVTDFIKILNDYALLQKPKEKTS